MNIISKNGKAPRLQTKGLFENQNQINAGGINKRFDVSNLSRFARFGQSIKCRKCSSDYMKFAVDGYCQDCQQKVLPSLQSTRRTLCQNCRAAVDRGDDFQQSVGLCKECLRTYAVVGSVIEKYTETKIRRNYFGGER